MATFDSDNSSGWKPRDDARESTPTIPASQLEWRPSNSTTRIYEPFNELQADPAPEHIVSAQSLEWSASSVTTQLNLELTGATKVTALDFSVEPREGNDILYLRVAHRKKGDSDLGVLYLIVDVLVPPLSGTVNLFFISLEFPGSNQDARFISTKMSFTETTRVMFTDKDATILFPDALNTLPSQVVISVFLTEFNKPVYLSKSFKLRAHSVSYDLFAKSEDSAKYGEYIDFPFTGHEGDGGMQHFGYDIRSMGFVKGVPTAVRDNSNTNESFFCYGRPIYSMADGTVVLAYDGEKDNPAPGRRGINRLATEWSAAETVNDISVVVMESTATSQRIVLATSNSGLLVMRWFDYNASGDTITPLGTIPLQLGQPVTQLDMITISLQRIVTVVQLGQTAQLSVWVLNMKNGTLTDVADAQISGMNIKSVKLLKISDSRFVAAVLDVTQILKLTVWDIVTDPVTLVTTLSRMPNPLEHLCTFGPISSAYDLVALSTPGRFVSVTSRSAVDLALRMVVWEIREIAVGTETIALIAQKLDFPTTERAAVRSSVSNHFGTVVRQLNGYMRFNVWKYEDSVITRVLEWTRESESSSVAGVPLFKGVAGTIMLQSKSASGRLHLSFVNVSGKSDGSEIKIELHNDIVETDYPAAIFSGAFITLGARGVIVTATNTGTGTTKLTLWRYSGGNTAFVVHGTELVVYSHFKEGSIPDKFTTGNFPKSPNFATVTRGEFLGELGNAGPSGGPHLHIHALRLNAKYLPLSKTTLQDLLNDLRDPSKNIERGDIGFLRPLQFKGCKGADKTLIVDGGPSKNPWLDDLNGHGQQLFPLAILPSGTMMRPVSPQPPLTGPSPVSPGVRTEQFETELDKRLDDVLGVPGLQEAFQQHKDLTLGEVWILVARSALGCDL